MAALLVVVQAARATPLNVAVINWSSVDGSDPVQLWDGPWSQGQDAAFFIAQAHFNERNVSIIPDLAKLGSCPLKIQIQRWCDTGGNLHWTAVNTLYASLKFPLHAIVGLGSLQDVLTGEPIGEAFGLPTVNHRVSAPIASDMRLFPLFVRTIPSDNQNADVIADLLWQFKFKQVSVLAHTDAVEFTQYFSGILADRFNFSARAVIYNYQQPLNAVDNSANAIPESLRQISLLTSNIIVCAAWTKELRMIADSAAQYGLLDAKYLWIFTYLDRHPSPSELQASQNLRNLMRGSLRITALVDNSNWKAFLSAWPSYERYRAAINSQLTPHGARNSLTCVDSKFVNQLPGNFFNSATTQVSSDLWAYAYDSVLALGMASCFFWLQNATVPNGTDLFNAIVNMGNFNVKGLSGQTLSFDPTDGDRWGTSLTFGIENWVDNTSASPVLVGTYHPERPSGTDRFQINSSLVMFKTGSGLQNLPSYVTVPDTWYGFLPTWAKVIALVEFVLVELLCVGAGLATLATKTHRVMASSQPMVLIWIAIGCGVAGMAIIPLTIDDNSGGIPSNNLAAISSACMAAPVLYVVGLAIALSALVRKMLHIRFLFSNQTLLHPNTLTMHFEKKNRVEHCVKLLGVPLLVVLLVLSCIIVIICWIVIAPLVWVRTVDSKDINGFVLASHGECTGSSASVAFLAVVFTLLGLILIVACFLAFRIRKLPSDYQESFYVGLVVIFTTQTYIIALPAVIAVYSSAVGRLLLLSSGVFITCSVILVLLFVPKLYFIAKGKPWWPSLDDDKRGSGSPGQPLHGYPLDSPPRAGNRRAYNQASPTSKQDSPTLNSEDVASAHVVSTSGLSSDLMLRNKSSLKQDVIQV